MGSKDVLQPLASGSAVSISAPIGQKAMAASVAVAIASDQSAVPISLAAGVDVTDRAGRALGVVASVTAAVDVSDRAARLVGIVDTELPAAAALSDALANPTTPQIGADLLLWDGTNFYRAKADQTNGLVVQQKRATLVQAASPAANTGATLTIPAAGAGLFHYITHIFIRRHATALLAGGATLAVTTTNLNGLTWRTGNQASITVDTADGMVLADEDYGVPIRSAVANTATTIVLPAPGAAVLWTAWVAYYIGP